MNFKKLLAKIAALFRTVKKPYMLVGGLAVAYWGYPRQSLDIDLVVDLAEKDLGRFFAAARKYGFAFHEAEIKLMLAKGNRFVMELDDFRVDCWLPKGEFAATSLRHRKKRSLFGTVLYIIGPEDLIAAKLLAGRPRDHEDIKTVLMRQGRKLNRQYLRRQVMMVDSLNQLDKIIAEIN